MAAACFDSWDGTDEEGEGELRFTGGGAQHVVVPGEGGGDRGAGLLEGYHPSEVSRNG